MIVAKFGGSSVRDAENMKNCAQIIERNPHISLVILSATYNTTNELDFLFSSFMEQGKTNQLSSLANDLIKRHRILAMELLGDECSALEELFEEFLNFISSWNEETKKSEGKFRDRTLSFGERFSTTLFYKYLVNLVDLKERKVEFVKSYDYLKTDSNYGGAHYIKGSLDQFKNECFQEDRLYVAQGYIGSNEDGDITTLGREGSDYSAALFAEAIGAEEVYIWTDVAGVFSCDPRITAQAKVIDFLSYEQASLMAKFGAKVLYPETMAPLISKGIKLWVKCTKEPELKGSLISEEPCPEEGGYALCIDNRADGVVLTQLGTGLKDREYPILEKTDHYIRYYIPAKDLNDVIEKMI